MASLVQWRQFSFFEQNQLTTELSSETHLVAWWHSASEITAHSFGRGQICLGDVNGFVHCVDKSLECSSFPAYEKLLTHLVRMKQRNVLLTIGYDSEESVPLLKCWDLDRVGEDKRPLCTRSVSIQVSQDEVQAATSLAACESSQQIAVGLGNGSIILLRGDLVNDRYIRQRILRLPDSRIALDNKFTPRQITGLGWKFQQANSASGLEQLSFLFVSTEDQVFGFRIMASGESREFQIDGGCRPHCASSNISNGDFIVARPEAIYVFGVEGRGPCYVLDDRKTSLGVFKNYACIIGKGSKSTERNDGLIIYDLKNKFIGFSAFYDSNVLFVVFAWGQLYVFTEDRKIYCLTEKDIERKLETLFNKNLFSVAINLAISNNLDPLAVSDIFRKFGDDLYSKGDYDGAMEQYLQTIGKLQPSYVILKYLDAKRIANLALYLQKLHEKNVASADHTTLLLNCYAKLRDSAKISEFIRREDVFFDVDTAISVCRSANFYEHAVYLAEKFKRHDIFIQIQLEDLRNYETVISYVSNLTFQEAEKTMIQFGKLLVSMAPEESTKLLVELCTGKHQSFNSRVKKQSSTPPPILRSNPEDFIHNFVNKKKWLTKFLEQYVQYEPECKSETVWNTLFELYLSPNDDSSSQTSDNEVLINFETRAVELLRNPKAHYNLDHVVVLCQLHNFLPGLLYLYEKSGRYNDIVQFHMDNGEFRQIIAACHKYSDKATELWVQALVYFSERPEDCRGEISEIFEVIKKHGLLSPLQVIDILARNPKLTLDLVKDFVLGQLENEMNMIQQDRKEVEKLSDETSKLEQEILVLDSNVITFQVGKCTSCSTMLDLPAVHFLCKHSYHIRCMGENEKECPKCVHENRKLVDDYANRLVNSNRHEKFYHDIAQAKDPFMKMTEYFGQNVFEDTK